MKLWIACCDLQLGPQSAVCDPKAGVGLAAAAALVAAVVLVEQRTRREGCYHYTPAICYQFSHDDCRKKYPVGVSLHWLSHCRCLSEL